MQFRAVSTSVCLSEDRVARWFDEVFRSSWICVFQYSLGDDRKSVGNVHLNFNIVRF